MTVISIELPRKIVLVLLLHALAFSSLLHIMHVCLSAQALAFKGETYNYFAKELHVTTSHRETLFLFETSTHGERKAELEKSHSLSFSRKLQKPV